LTYGEAGRYRRWCRRRSTIANRKINSFGRTATFSLGPLILYIPVNIYPPLLSGAAERRIVYKG
jgi:hypothetical protein